MDKSGAYRQDPVCACVHRDHNYCLCSSARAGTGGPSQARHQAQVGGCPPAQLAILFLIEPAAGNGRIGHLHTSSLCVELIAEDS